MALTRKATGSMEFIRQNCSEKIRVPEMSHGLQSCWKFLLVCMFVRVFLRQDWEDKRAEDGVLSVHFKLPIRLGHIPGIVIIVADRAQQEVVGITGIF